MRMSFGHWTHGSTLNAPEQGTLSSRSNDSTTNEGLSHINLLRSCKTKRDIKTRTSSHQKSADLLVTHVHSNVLYGTVLIMINGFDSGGEKPFVSAVWAIERRTRCLHLLRLSVQ